MNGLLVVARDCIVTDVLSLVERLGCLFTHWQQDSPSWHGVVKALQGAMVMGLCPPL